MWLAILGALVLTALMLWVLDRSASISLLLNCLMPSPSILSVRFSPYSARNNPDAHPGPCRQFTLKESFWFALTSFTPQVTLPFVMTLVIPLQPLARPCPRGMAGRF